MTSSTDVHDAIVAAGETYMTTFSRGDAAGIAALFTESAQLLMPNTETITGKQAIQAVFQSIIDMGIKAIKLQTLETEGYGDTAFEVGRYTIEDEGGQELDQGKYLVIWKKEGGQWKLHRDISNTSVPAPE